MHRTIDYMGVPQGGGGASNFCSQDLTRLSKCFSLVSKKSRNRCDSAMCFTRAFWFSEKNSEKEYSSAHITTLDE